MNQYKTKLELLEEALDKISPDELYEKFYGYKKHDMEQYISTGEFYNELTSIVSTVKSIGGFYEFPEYGTSLITPTKMFWNHLTNISVHGYDSDWFDGYGAYTETIKAYNFTHKYVNGQGTIHYFIVE